MRLFRCPCLEVVDRTEPNTNKLCNQSLHEGQLVGGNVEGVDIGRKAGVGLLGTIGARSLLGLCRSRVEPKHGGNIPDESVDLEGINVIELLKRLLDLGLVGLDVDDEDEGVVLLNLLHGALGVERANDDLVLIEARKMGDRLARVLGSAGDDEGLGAVERSAQADLALLLGVGLKKVKLAMMRLGPCRGSKHLRP